MKIFAAMGNIVDRLCILAGACLGSQIPQFFLQYSQRLSGHVAELQQLVDQLRSAAATSHKTLDQYILKFLSSSDPDFASQGAFMQKIFQRWEDLHQALLHLSQSSVWWRPFAFIRELQPDIAQSTMAAFQPGLTLTLEGFCYMVLGAVLGWGIYQFVSKILFLAYRKLSEKGLGALTAPKP